MSNPVTQLTGKSPSSRLLTFLEPLADAHVLSNGYMASTLFLLRALYGLSEVGNTLDDLIEPFPIIPAVCPLPRLHPLSLRLIFI